VFLDVEYLPPQREDGLELGVAALFGAVVDEHARREGEVMGSWHFEIVHVRRLVESFD